MRTDFIDYLRSIFSFDPLTGDLRWSKPRKRIRIGDIAGTLRPDGYRQVCIDQKLYLTHRIIFAIKHGYFPIQVDHVRGDKENYVDLREATHVENMRNRKLQKNNTSGYRGVSLDRQTGKWIAKIKITDKQTIIGRYATPQEASAAYQQVARTAFGEFYRADE